MPSGQALFTDIPASIPVSGTVNYGTSTGFGGYTISGTVNRLVKIGVVSDFFDPSASVLPEPATWATMILGMGAVGIALRRRRRTSTRVSFA